MKSHFHEYENATYHLMLQSLIDFYLKNKNFEALMRLRNADWKSQVLSEPISELIWVHVDNTGDYFVTESAQLRIEQIIVNIFESREDNYPMQNWEHYREVKMPDAIKIYSKETQHPIYFMPSGNECNQN